MLYEETTSDLLSPKCVRRQQDRSIWLRLDSGWRYGRGLAQEWLGCERAGSSKAKWMTFCGRSAVLSLGDVLTLAIAAVAADPAE